MPIKRQFSGELTYWTRSQETSNNFLQVLLTGIDNLPMFSQCGLWAHIMDRISLSLTIIHNNNKIKKASNKWQLEQRHHIATEES